MGYSAGRDMTLFDTEYRRGDQIPDSVIGQVLRIESLIRSRHIVVSDDAAVLSPAVVEQVPSSPASNKIKDVLDWVGGDKERASLILDKELDSKNPRKRLVESLRELG